MNTLTPYNDGRLLLWTGDCLTLMAGMAENSVDAIVTDPPYGLGFMGKQWDTPGSFVERKADTRNKFDHVGGNHNPTSSADAARTRRVENRRFGEWCAEWTEAAFRVLKPGGHMLAFGGTRTWHRLAVAVEDAGFEIRDSMAWLYGSGFPKSMDVPKAIEKAVAKDAHWADADPAAWEGWGTALKPAFEPIVVARKPLPKKATVATNVLLRGTGALNIDGCRIEHASEADRAESVNKNQHAQYGSEPGAKNTYGTKGRWPTNVALDESQAEVLDGQSGTSKSRKGKPRGSAAPGEGWGMTATGSEYDDLGGASRFFYCAKAPKKERPVLELPDGTKLAHPTVKPLSLMRWLVRLVTPPDGLVLDTFAGTGTTGEAAVLEGFRCLLAEDPTKGEQDYTPLIDLRIKRAIEAYAKDAANQKPEAQETVA